MRLLAPALILFAIAGCAAAPQLPLAARPAALPIRGCNAHAALPLVGQIADDAARKRAKELTGARTVRVVRPRQPQAMNFDSGRLDIEVDRSGKITGFSCG